MDMAALPKLYRQQTEIIEPMFFCCRYTVCGIGSKSNQHTFNISCLLECLFSGYIDGGHRQYLRLDHYVDPCSW